MSEQAICTGYHIRSSQGDELWIDSVGFSTGSAIGFQTRRCTRQEADSLIGKPFDECLKALTAQRPPANNQGGDSLSG